MIKKFLLGAMLVMACRLSAQTESKKEVEQVVKTFFEGFHKGDTLLMKQAMADNLIFQTAYKDKEQRDVLKQDDVSSFIKAIGSGRPVTEKWEERITSYTIKIDGNMANAWTEYEFWRDGEFSHCGVNSFQLFRDNGAWKIIYLIDTRRRSDCKVKMQPK